MKLNLRMMNKGVVRQIYFTKDIINKLMGVRQNGNSANRSEGQLTKSEEESIPNSNSAQSSNDYTAEVGGREGLDPVRYGDWERNGIAVDF